MVKPIRHIVKKKVREKCTQKKSWRKIFYVNNAGW